MTVNAEPRRDKGSYRHMLDLAASPKFESIINHILDGTGARLASPDNRHPKGRMKAADWTEMILEDYLKACPLPQLQTGMDRKWWMPYTGNRPTWDLLGHLVVNGEPGLLLVEAKARVGEVGDQDSKSPAEPKNPRSVANDLSIRLRFAEASLALSDLGYGKFQLSTEHQYQLSNRLAYLNQLTSLGVPTVLVYLGWVNSPDWPTNEPLKDGRHWEKVVKTHFAKVGPWEFVSEKKTHESGGSMQMVVRAVSPDVLND